jgi:hypothetical protein
LTAFLCTKGYSREREKETSFLARNEVETTHIEEERNAIAYTAFRAGKAEVR